MTEGKLRRRRCSALVLCVACFAAACATSSQFHGRRVTSPAPAVAFKAPRVYLLTSSASCDGGPADDISEQLRADARAFRTAFPSAVVLDATRFPAHATPLAAPPSNSDHPMLFFYAGHGVSRPNSDGQMESRLCLPGGELSFRELARWVRARSRVSIIILNACESAHVDPSIAGLGDMSVLSASLDETISRGVVSADAGTPLTAGLTSLLERTPLQDADQNCDAIITDQELFDALQNELRVRSWNELALGSGTQLQVPIPKLRRNADRPIALLGHDSSSPRCTATRGAFERVARVIPDFAMRAAEERDALLDRRRRVSERDYFVMIDDAGSLRSRGSCSELRKEESIVCRTFETHLDLLPLPARGVDLGDVRALARTLAIHELYAVKVAAPWVEVLRLRDGMTTSVSTVEHAAVAVPAAQRTVQRALDGSVHRLYSKKVCHEELTALDARPIPCAVSSGQCFRLNREPAGTEDACP